MEPPKSISIEVFELFNKVIEQANRIDRVLRSLEDKNKRYDEVVFQFENFANNLKNQLSSFVENTHFQIEKSLNLYKHEHERLVTFFNENEKTRELYYEAQKLYNELGDLKLKYDSLTSQFNDAYQKFQSMLENLSEKADKYFEKTTKELKDKIDSEIQKKVDRDIKAIENNIMLKNKLLEGKVSELNNAVNTLYSIFQLPEFQTLFDKDDKKTKSQPPSDDEEVPAWQEARKLDKIDQKHQNFTSELELKIDQIREMFKDFEARLNKDKKEISKIYDSMLEREQEEYKQLRDKVHDIYYEIDVLKKTLLSTKNQILISMILAGISLVTAIIISFL